MMADMIFKNGDVVGAMLRMSRALHKIMDATENLEDGDEFLSVIAVAIDRYGSNHGWTAEETRRKTRAMFKAQEISHGIFGLDPSKKYDDNGDPIDEDDKD